MVYQHGGSRQGEVWIAPIVDELKKIAKQLRIVSAVLVVGGVVGLVVIYLPLTEAMVRYEVRVQGSRLKVQGPTPEPTRVVLKPEWEVPDPNYSVFIPKLDAKSRVIANVDAGNEKVYQEALKLGVAAVAGLANPGERGTTYLFSHSVSNPINFVRYNAVFYLLDRLEIGDGIEVVYQGKLLKYEVSGREITRANDLKYLVPQQEEEKLVMQTCYPPGTTWQRLYVTAKRVY